MSHNVKSNIKKILLFFFVVSFLFASLISYDSYAKKGEEKNTPSKEKKEKSSKASSKAPKEKKEKKTKASKEKASLEEEDIPEDGVPVGKRVLIFESKKGKTKFFGKKTGLKAFAMTNVESMSKVYFQLLSDTDPLIKEHISLEIEGGVEGKKYNIEVTAENTWAKEGFEPYQKIDDVWEKITSYTTSDADGNYIIGLRNVEESTEYAFINSSKLFKDANLLINPFGAAPLSALLVFKTEELVDVEIVVKGQNNNDINYLYEGVKGAGKLPVHGLYANCRTPVTAIITTEAGLSIAEPFFATTKVDITRLPKDGINIKQNSLDTNTNEIYYVSGAWNSGKAFDPVTDVDFFGFDAFGKIRHIFSTYSEYLDVATQKKIKLETNWFYSNILYKGEECFFTNKHGSSDGYIIDRLGRIQAKLTAPNNLRLHHEAKVNNDTIYLVAENSKGFDYILTAPLSDLTAFNSYPLGKFFDTKKPKLKGCFGGPFHTNGLSFDESNNIIVSMRNHGVGSINLATNKLNWVAGAPIKKYKPKSKAIAKVTLKPSNFKDVLPQWFRGQHTAEVISYNKILMFDNSMSGPKGHQPGRIALYSIDLPKKKIALDWQYKLGTADLDFFTGSTYYDQNSGNVVAYFPLSKTVIEIPLKENKPTFEAQIVDDRLATYYRIYKTSLFCEE